ncbi:MAG: RNA polymerase sigma factor [Ruthenibacterium lactatiformans]
MQEIEQIYTQYRQDVYRYLCSLTRDAALAEDLLSETFLRALTGLSGFRKGACVRTWLFSIARHVWIDGLRRKRHVLSGDELLARYVEEGGPGAPPFETQVDARALAARAKELLQTRRRPPESALLRAQGYSFAETHRGAASAKARPHVGSHAPLAAKLQKEGAEL